MKLNELLEHAAWLLEKEAKAVKGSCRVGGQEWACPDCVDKLKCGSRMDYDDFTDTAKELRQHHVTAELMASDD